MQHYKKSAAKQGLFNDVNNGRVRILIGSTQTMGTGVNAQQRLAALHHLDVPWLPSDIEQREGRIERQGNQNEEIDVFAYTARSRLWSGCRLYQRPPDHARLPVRLSPSAPRKRDLWVNRELRVSKRPFTIRKLLRIKLFGKPIWITTPLWIPIPWSRLCLSGSRAMPIHRYFAWLLKHGSHCKRSTFRPHPVTSSFGSLISKAQIPS